MDHANGAAGVPRVANGMNGHLKASMASSTVKKPSPRPRRSSAPRFLLWAWSLAARILTWYSIVTILLRCPATLQACDRSSPAVCRSYFQLKQAVLPHVAPYYVTYVAPYVDVARPYYNTFEDKVVDPSVHYAKIHAVPRARQVQVLGQAQWEKRVQPQLLRFQARARDQYDRSLAPHVQQLSQAISPYYGIVRTNVLQAYHDSLLPSFELVHCYAQQLLTATSAFASGTAAPAIHRAWNRTHAFLDSTVWPQLRAMYVEKVEPQLVKIGERLGRYNGKKSATRSVVGPPSSAGGKTSPSSFVKPASPAFLGQTSAGSSAATHGASTGSEAHSLKDHATTEPARLQRPDPVPPPEVDDNEPEDATRRSARETVAADLKDWQERYAKAADEAAVQVEGCVDDIAKRMVRRDVRTTGKSLVQALGNTVDAELAALRKQVMEIVQAEKLKESQRKMGLEAVDDAEERLAKAVRRAGSAIRDQAQAVRTWRESYEAELHNSVTQAAEAHFKMLESIRDLALQKIGMKWAWMDGVTYKDWAKFHLLKERFEEWQGDFEKLIVTHPGLQAAQEEGADVEDEAMTRAAAAAQELARLKQVALWKLIARDDTDDFDGNVMAQKAAAAEKAAAEAHVAKLEAHRAFAAEYDSKAADAATESSESSESSESNAEPEPDLAQTMVLEETPVVADKASDVDDDVPGPAVLPEGEAAEQGETVQPPFLGAAAQWVPSRHPILDEEPALDKVQTAIGSLTLAAQAAFSGAVCRADQQYSQALSALSVQMSGARQPAHEKMLASATQAYSNVMAAASSRYSDAVSPAQQQQQQQHDATPTTPGLMDKLLPSAVPMPTISSIDWAAIEAMAAQKLNEGRAWAEEQYTSAQVAIGLATPAPSTPAEHAGRLLDTARHNYYAGLGLAHARYADFMAAASAAALSLTASPTPTDFVGSAMSAASAAGDTWDAVLSRVSAGVYGAPTPAPAPRCEQGLSRGLSEAAAAVAAKERYEAVSNLVAELLVGREPTFRESVFARLEQAYTTGAQGVGVVVDAAKETATALADGAAEAAGQATHVVKEAAAAVAGAEVQTMVRDEL